MAEIVRGRDRGPWRSDLHGGIVLFPEVEPDFARLPGDSPVGIFRRPFRHAVAGLMISREAGPQHDGMVGDLTDLDSVGKAKGMGDAGERDNEQGEKP